VQLLSTFATLGLARVPKSVVKILGAVRTKLRFALVGYVVMPEHVHLLSNEPPEGAPSDVMRDLKQRVARALLSSDSHDEFREPNRSRPWAFWQTRFYDFNVFTRKKHNKRLNYTHMNPVRRGLMKNPNDWPWSSYRGYMKTGPVVLSVDTVE
jgi:putative transposase